MRIQNSKRSCISSNSAKGGSISNLVTLVSNHFGPKIIALFIYFFKSDTMTACTKL